MSMARAASFAVRAIVDLRVARQSHPVPVMLDLRLIVPDKQLLVATRVDGAKMNSSGEP